MIFSRPIKIEPKEPEAFKLPPVLSIAGSDSSGGAGIQADIKTIQSLGMFAETAITAITAQNTMGVTAVQNIDPAIVEAQIDAVFADIKPRAVKVGMVSSSEIVRAIAAALERNNARNIVVDPVMVATSGSSLADDGAVVALREKLFPMATVITPNLQEAAVLTGFEITTTAQAEQAARQISEACGAAVLVKGGHGLFGPERTPDQASEAADDVLCEANGVITWMYGTREDNPNTHGTGCTLSSAVASFLAVDYSLPKAVGSAKEYLTGALKAQLNMGQGSGPLDHFWQYRENY